jgi:Glucose / Sorbosone dehydrogenase
VPIQRTVRRGAPRRVDGNTFAPPTSLGVAQRALVPMVSIPRATNPRRFGSRFCAVTALGAILSICAPAGAQTDADHVRSSAAVELTWTQEGSPSVFQRFDIVVDSVRRGLIGVACRPVDGDSECEVPLPGMPPGTHTVELIAVTPQGESSPSQPLQIVIEPSVLLHGSVAPAGVARNASSASSMACADQRCFAVSVLSQGAGVIDRLAALPDGRVLLVRNAREVLVLGDRNVAVAYTARSDSRRDESIADIAVDPAFADTHLVYLAVVTRDATGARSVRVVRSREVGGQLGEQTTIVPDVRVGVDASTPLALDRGGHVYLSLPGGGSTTRDPYEGAVLAFTADGNAAGALLGSPVLARVANRPAAIVPNPAAEDIWVVEAEQTLSRALRVVRRATSGIQTFTVGTGAADTGDNAVRAVAFTSVNEGMLAMAQNGLVLFALSRDLGTISRIVPLPLGDLRPTAIAATTTGDLIVAAVDATDQRRSTVLRLSPVADQ